MGEACQRALSGKCHSGLPLLASSAPNEPSSSPKNSRPPAVASTPPQASPGPCCSTCHTILPVLGSMARRYLRGVSLSTRLDAPPMKDWPCFHHSPFLVKMLHFSSAIK